MLQTAAIKPKAIAELAQSPGMRECLQWFSKERRWIDEQHLEICRVPAPTFLEERRAEWMGERLRSLGWDAKVDRAGNVVASSNGEKDGPFIALTAHLDTVLAPQRPEDVSVDSDGRFRGPGVSDNGAGLAAMLAVAGAWKACPAIEQRTASLLLVANVGEEGEGNLSGMRFLCKQSPLAQKIRSYLVLDGPSTDHITCQALASRRFEIVFSGPGGHSWSDHGNANPVHALSRVISMYTDNQWNNHSRNHAPRCSFNFGLIEGGLSVNSIPTQARAKLDLRSESPERMDQLADLLADMVERALEMENKQATGGRVIAKVREIGSRPGGSLRDNAPILPYVRAVDTHLGIRAHLDCASTDANIPLSMGIPAVSIGAGGQGGGAHTPAEWFDPEGRDLGLRRILLTLGLLLRDPSN